MAIGGYIGKNGVANKLNNLYVGSGSVARAIKRGYVGVGGVARLCYERSYQLTRNTSLPITDCKIYYPICGAVGNNFVFHSQDIRDDERGTDAKDSDGDYGYTFVAYDTDMVKTKHVGSGQVDSGAMQANTPNRILYAGGLMWSDNYHTYTFATNAVHTVNSNLTSGPNTTLFEDKTDGDGVSTSTYAIFTGGRYYDGDPENPDVHDSTVGSAFDSSLNRTKIAGDTHLFENGWGFPSGALYCRDRYSAGGSNYADISKIDNALTTTTRKGTLIPYNAVGLAGVGSSLLAASDGDGVTGPMFYRVDMDLTEHNVGTAPVTFYGAGTSLRGSYGSNGNIMLWACDATSNADDGDPTETWYMGTDYTFVQGPDTSYEAYGGFDGKKYVAAIGDRFLAYLGWYDTSSSSTVRPSAGYGKMNLFEVKYE